MKGRPDSRIWEHAAETVLFLDVAALAAAAVLPGHGVPGWPIPTVEAAAGVIAGFTIWCLTGSARFSWTATAFGAWLAIWSAWARHSGLWHTTTFTTWLLSLFVFIPATALAAASARVTQAEQAVPVKPDPQAEKLAEMAKFSYMFSELGLPDVDVVDLTSDPAGRVVRLALPRSGKITLENLESIAGGIAVILRLKRGCVEFEEQSHSADIIMRLRERNFLAGSIPLRPEHRAATINKPFAVGIQEDGSVATITLRELHAYIIGTTGSGKSNLINVLLAQLCSCVDTVIWVIDMKGGLVARPWLRPYAEGKAGAPALDWVATTREEAAIMMRCFLLAVETRMNSDIGGSKIIPSASRPQIILITDEMADLFGADGIKGSRKEVGEGATTNQEFVRMAETLTQKGRALAASSVWASQRGTNSMAGSGDMKANCKLRILLGVANRNEARYVNGDSQVAQKRAAAAVDSPGSGVITMSSKTSLPVKFFLHDHPPKPGSETGESLCDEGCVPACPVYRTALETAAVRPQLDRETAEGMGEDYARRWERAGKVLRRPVTAGAMPRRGQDVDTSQFAAIMAEGGVKDPEAKMTPAQKRMLEILAARGAMGATPNHLYSELEKEGLAPGARETLQRWLARFMERGLVHNASFGRWKAGPGDEADAA